MSRRSTRSAPWRSAAWSSSRAAPTRPGAPVLYGTSERFLKLFGLVSRDDLPPLEEFSLGADEVDEIRSRLHANAERRAQ